MSIVTKKGDSGTTSLFLGGMVAKDDPRVELDGTLDELCSFLGLAKSLARKSLLKGRLESIQKDLFVIGAEAATAPPFLNKLNKKIDGNDIKKLEGVIDILEARRRPSERVFCLPGKNLISSVLDVARTVARRAERRAATAFKKKLVRNGFILIYLNRLSDLLYLLARAAEK
ncbi:MAG TPA: cob(I)yrinic acid a,c-diamide adenosyltransferase [Candidatus Omnitrophica bacterium]|nr:cob(I)yrinic acid a,c-diamide adenosyltransferase [Candidatus Omnitrophota bacterium]